MDYAECLPDDPLRPLVRCYWFLSGAVDAGGAPGDPALPDGSPELIFNLADPFQAFRADGAPVVQPLTMLVGQITGPFVVGPTGRVDLVAVRFEACGAVALCDHLAAITDEWLDARRLGAGVAAIAAALRRTASRAGRVTVLNGQLRILFANGRAPDQRVASAVRAIRESHGAVGLDQLAAGIGVTPRTLQRLFSRDVGISPKFLARIVRFQRVFAAWRDDPRSLARVAAECGYFDQSHLVRDFRDFAGAAPAAFLVNQPEFTAFFTTGSAPG